MNGPTPGSAPVTPWYATRWFWTVALSIAGLAILTAFMLLGTALYQFGKQALGDQAGRLLSLVLIAMFVGIAIPLWMTLDRDAHYRRDYFKLVQRAESGQINARFELGMLYLKGDIGIPRNPSGAIHWLEQAAGAGHGKAALELARLIHRGIGIPRDSEQAMIWLQYAIETGSEEARKLRDLWECGNDEPPAPQVTLEPVQVQEPRAWNRWVDRLPRWMISAPLGLLLLISTLGALAFFLGTATALLLFSWTISELGTTFFAVQLVMILLTFGIAIWWLRSPQMRFKRKVRRLFTRAQAGHPEAQRELALAYLEGSHGLPKDSSQALWWMRRCAENGAAHDAYILAQWMDQGIGQFRNRREAMVWLQHAANEGYGPAKVLIARWSSGIDT